MAIVPPKTPEITRAETLGLLAAAGITAITRAVLVGVRGYYTTMGAAGNDRGIYDDAIVLLSPTAYLAYNANTDPSATGKGTASLVSGLWLFKLGTHNRSKPVDKQYEALIQNAEFTVARDDTQTIAAGTKHPTYGVCLGDGQWKGWFGINLHRGGVNTTGSEGCQTIYKPQWDSFIATVKMEMKRHGQTDIQYLLTEKAV